MIDKRVFYCLLIVGILLFWLFFILVLRVDGGIIPEPINNTKEVNALQEQNDALINKVAELELQNYVYKEKIDSLAKAKEKIQVKYVTKYKEIMLANSNELSAKFDSLFAKFGIK